MQSLNPISHTSPTCFSAAAKKRAKAVIALKTAGYVNGITMNVHFLLRTYTIKWKYGGPYVPFTT